MKCPGCQYENDSKANFCSNCGVDLRTTRKKAGVPRLADHSERRQVTAMFCDLVGSTSLSEKLELEDYSALVTDYQQICRESIGNFDGQVHQFLGDGVVTFFGFPKAHEDDARRSVLCALEIIREIQAANIERAKLGKLPLAIRIGIHTGMIVGGDISGEKQVLGKTPNMAARLEGIAEVGSVAISPAT